MRGGKMNPALPYIMEDCLEENNAQSIIPLTIKRVETF